MTKRLLIVLLLLAAFAPRAAAQFKSEAFSQNDYGEDADSQTDSVKTLFSLKEYFGGLLHRNDLKIGNMFGGSTVFVGGSQIYNRDYWKLPIVYGGLGATIGMGFKYRKEENTRMSTLMFAGAGLIYWGTLMDGVVSFDGGGKYPHPGKATLYSLLLPGLGQLYNGEGWKIPIYWGGLLGAWHFLDLNQTNYQRYRRIYREATDPETVYDGPISADTALYYRDIYRRYRDYSILAVAAFYLLQVIDANVFAYMQNFEVNDDLSLRVSPALITPDNAYAFQSPGVGLRLGLTF